MILFSDRGLSFPDSLTASGVKFSGFFKEKEFSVHLPSS